ncbi:MAG TPA: hypothetical protein VFA51_05010 [Candidatus Udaeobacter sp.]|nr:hypothetical protein [Candidatus Udaeobacter sp.]
MKYWEIIADNLRKAGWSLGWVSTLNCDGQTTWVVDAHRDDGKRFVVRADELLTGFLELEALVRNETLRASKLEQPFLPLPKMRPANGHARTAGSDFSRDKPRAESANP